MQTTIQPPFLKTGDAVAIVTTARKVTPEELMPAKAFLTHAGFKVLEAPNLYATWNQFGGSDEQRSADLQWAIDHSDIRAICFARGGYGSLRIIDSVDFSSLRTNPKWLIGFSDITAILLHAYTLGVQSIHATMPFIFNKETEYDSANALVKTLMGEPYSYTLQGNGDYKEITGNVIGGNLTLIHQVLGTLSEPVWEEAILFLEEIDEYYYHIDRMILHLDRYGMIGKLKACISGYFTDIKDNAIPFGLNEHEIIQQYTLKRHVPYYHGLSVGHDFPNFPIILGATHRIYTSGAKNYTIELV